MPDFVLSSADTQVPQIAVFCDSRRWHCSPEANRLADDADKRAALRDQDYLVWAVTHRDLDAFATVLDGELPHHRRGSATRCAPRSSKWRRRSQRRAASRPTPC